MFYQRELILFIFFIILIVHLSQKIDKKEMEVAYFSKINSSLPSISICTYQNNILDNCKNRTNLKVNIQEFIKFKNFYNLSLLNKFRKKIFTNHYFVNHTLEELFSLEEQCNNLSDLELKYIYYNKSVDPFNITSYLNLGLFCKLYQFKVKENLEEGYFKINSIKDKNFFVFVHELEFIPNSINLRIFSNDFYTKNVTFLYELEHNKVLTPETVIFDKKENPYQSERDCIEQCYKKFNITFFHFYYTKNEPNYKITSKKFLGNKLNLTLFDNKCKKKCNFDYWFLSHFKIEKTTSNCKLIPSFERTYMFKNWIIFHQASKIVLFKFNNVVTFKVFLIYVCNALSLVFGISFFSFKNLIKNLIPKIFDKKKNETKFDCFLVSISIFFSFIQSMEIILEYRQHKTATALKMDLDQITPNISISLCFNDFLKNYTNFYDFKLDLFHKEKFNCTYQEPISKIPIKDILNMVNKKNIQKLFLLQIQISNKFKFVNTLINSDKIFIRKGRYCFRVDLQMSDFITNTKNKVKKFVESEIYLHIKANEFFDRFYISRFKTLPNYLNQPFYFESIFRFFHESQASSSLGIKCLNYKNVYDCDDQINCIEKCLIKNYFKQTKKIPFNTNFVLSDYWSKILNKSMDKLFLDTNNLFDARRLKILKKCKQKYLLIDCDRFNYYDVNSRIKNKNDDLKISLFFDKVLIYHFDKTEFISLIIYLIGIYSLWLGFSFKTVNNLLKKVLLNFLGLKKTIFLINTILVIGFVWHSYYIIELTVQNKFITTTYYQPTNYVFPPIVSICFDLKKINLDKRLFSKREYNGFDLLDKTKKLSQLISYVKFLNNNASLIELDKNILSSLENNSINFSYENLKLKTYFYSEYKCFEFKQSFSSENLKLDHILKLNDVLFEVGFLKYEFEFMFYPLNNFNIENKIFIPSSSYNSIKYVSVYSIPLHKNLLYCFDNLAVDNKKIIQYTRLELRKNKNFKIATKLIPLTIGSFNYTIRDDIFYDAIYKIKQPANWDFKYNKTCHIKYRNVVLTQIVNKKKLFKVQLKPSLIDVIVKEEPKFSFYEQVLQISSVLLFWLDISLRDFFVLLELSSKKMLSFHLTNILKKKVEILKY